MNNLKTFESYTNEDRELFLQAVVDNDYKTVEKLIKQGVDPSLNDNYAITIAITKCYYSMLKILLADSRVDPGINDQELYINALRLPCSARIVELLLNDPRIDVEASNFNAIMYNVRYYKNIEILKLLLEDGRTDPSTNNNSILSHAYFNGYSDIVDLLMTDNRVIFSLNKMKMKMDQSGIYDRLMQKYSFINTHEDAKMFIRLL